MELTKTCTCCGETFPATTEYFHKKKGGKYGLKARCKTCISKMMTEYHDRPETKARRAEYDSRPERKARRAEYNARPETKAYYAEYNARPENKARKKAYDAEYNARPEIKTRKRKRHNGRYNNDPDYRLKNNMRRMFNHFLNGNLKQCSVFDLTGCTLSELWDHLESKFEDGMTRENYGEWHVDHIIPLSKFDPNCWMQMSVAWDVDNLQPLWAKDNLSKGDKLDWSKS